MTRASDAARGVLDQIALEDAQRDGKKKRRSLGRHYAKGHYGGKGSRPFWTAINGHADHETLYELGCALQSMEHAIRSLEEHILARLEA